MHQQLTLVRLLRKTAVAVAVVVADAYATAICLKAKKQ